MSRIIIGKGKYIYVCITISTLRGDKRANAATTDAAVELAWSLTL